jgi:hypothetical protein
MTVRPLKFDSDGSGNSFLQDMNDSDLERLIYSTQRAYAEQLIANGDGHVNVGGSGTAIGSASDTSSTQRTNTTVRGLNDGIIQTFPAFPGIGSETDATYSYKQDRTTPSAVSSANFNVRGLLFYDSANDELEPFSTEAQLAAIITEKAITNMRTGDEVGSLRVSTSAPNSGGAGTWQDLGTFFSDTTFNQGTTTYKLWCKKQLDTAPGFSAQEDRAPVGLDSDGGGTAVGNLIRRGTGKDQLLIQQVLLPALTRKMAEGMYYSVATSTGSGDSAGGRGMINRGAFTDTKQTGTSNSQTFSNPNYNSTSTPSGTASTVTTYYLNMLA